MHNFIPKSLLHREIIKCKPMGKYLGNYKCHANCLSYALRKGNVSKIIGVAQIFNDESCVTHFILLLIDGTYIDPTYGNLTNVMYSHNIIIEEYEVDTFNPNRELNNLRNYIFNLLPWYHRLFHKNPY